MSKARLVITAIEVGGRSAAEVVADYGISRSWLYELLARYRATSASAGPTPGPTSYHSSRTCTCASSTPPPVSSSVR
jgi:transposase